MFKRVFPVLLLSTVMVISGCGSDEPPPVSSRPVEPAATQAPAASQNGNAAGASPASHGGVTVTIRPTDPVVGSCVEAGIKGRPSSRVFSWFVNGSLAQQGEGARYCLENVQRGDRLSVTIGDTNAGATDAVTVGNALPVVSDTRVEMTVREGRNVIEVTPEVGDADGDYVLLQYQWHVNGRPLAGQTENWLGAEAYSRGDVVEVRITPDDGYDKGRPYQSQAIRVPSALPVITSQPPTAFEAMEYAYQLVASDPDGTELTYRLDEAPEGMSIDAATGAIRWPLADVPPGDYRVKVVVADADGSEVFQQFTVTVGERVIRPPQ